MDVSIELWPYWDGSDSDQTNNNYADNSRSSFNDGFNN